MLFFTLKNDTIISKNRGGILDVIVWFFRDFLSGPLYIVVAIIAVIGIAFCVYYLVQATIKQKEEIKKISESYGQVHLLPTDSSSASTIASNVETSISSAQLNHVGDVATTNLAQSAVPISSDMVAAVTGHSNEQTNHQVDTNEDIEIIDIDDFDKSKDSKQSDIKR